MPISIKNNKICRYYNERNETLIIHRQYNLNKLLKLISEVSMVAEYEDNISKLIAYLHPDFKKLEHEILNYSTYNRHFLKHM